LVSEVPMELSLELMAMIGADSVYAKRKLLNKVIGESNCHFLIMASVHPECSYSGGIINRWVLETTDLRTVCGL